jgi:hypothetical protein
LVSYEKAPKALKDVDILSIIAIFEFGYLFRPSLLKVDPAGVLVRKQPGRDPRSNKEEHLRKHARGCRKVVQ